jgi:iron complex transport system substrate-binding protein
MADTLVGRSHCCDYPPEVADLPVLSASKVDYLGQGGAGIDRDVRALLDRGESVYRVLQDELVAVAPDVVLTQDHCDACAVSLRDVEHAVRCADLLGAVVCALHPHDLDGVLADMGRVAEALGVPDRGARLADRTRRRLDAVRRATEGRPRPGVLMIEWLEPPMVAGGWMPELVRIAGGDPLVVHDAHRFEEVDWRDVARARADVVVVLPCGYGVGRSQEELGRVVRGDSEARRALAAIPVRWVVDGDAYFNRPGPRLADSAELLAALLHPGAAPVAPGSFAGSFASIEVTG